MVEPEISVEAFLADTVLLQAHVPRLIIAQISAYAAVAGISQQAMVRGVLAAGLNRFHEQLQEPHE
jgi:hypothetical protein